MTPNQIAKLVQLAEIRRRAAEADALKVQVVGNQIAKTRAALSDTTYRAQSGPGDATDLIARAGWAKWSAAKDRTLAAKAESLSQNMIDLRRKLAVATGQHDLLQKLQDKAEQEATRRKAGNS